MTPVEPDVHEGGHRVVFDAPDGSGYESQPASVDGHGTVVVQWKPTVEDLEALASGGEVRVELVAWSQPLTPIVASVVPPTVPPRGPHHMRGRA